MAKIKHPLHSISASGTIGGAISFRATARGAVAANTPQPYAQKSSAQLANQQRMSEARAAFKTLSTADRGHWQTLASKYRRSAWACFFAEYQYQFTQTPNMPLIPEANL